MMGTPRENSPRGAEGRAHVTDATDPDTGSTLEDARTLLAFCRDHAEREDALETLAAMGPWLTRRELAGEVLDAVEAVTRPVLATPTPSVAAQALMVIVLSAMLDVEGHGKRVDALFMAWLRHPTSYGPSRATPKGFQRMEFVQRVADLLGWGDLDVKKDREPLARFAAWVNSWSTGNRFKVRRILGTLQRNFPAQGVWDQVRFG